MASPVVGDFKYHRTALIDGDILVWKASAYAESHQEDELDLEERVLIDVNQWMTRAFCSEAIVCFSGPRDLNFRREVYPIYKTNRKDERPEFHNMAVRILRDNFKVFERETLEADDCMGLLATLNTVTNPVIVTTDKDLRTVPGWHFNPDKEDFPVYVSYQQADLIFLTQWITGDRTDGYKGIEGVGEAGARKILVGTPIDRLTWAVLNAYKTKGCTYEYALQMARCARILTAEWWDPEAKTPILWVPGANEVDGHEDWMDGKDALGCPMT